MQRSEFNRKNEQYERIKEKEAEDCQGYSYDYLQEDSGDDEPEDEDVTKV